ncbi:ABC transporter ATP-binding protein [Lipingzhangella sp. LS1_29]|uniref:ABC transporter ATP-binding protein n=1 Tax=Lipingzhangella rawalii TaxID=2055835 RepID=A0ABU2H218_9ACTN|nr:ABC transporter ATP-binding protein [Lipingzhangella rawalii]MDS1269354.1 ABC transporter ATP-binding protein [Lipingzhangella rawalii]
MSSSTADPDPHSEIPVFRRGLRVLWVAMRTEPWVFALAVLGSAVHAVTNVASAHVLGYLTDTVILPSLDSGATTTALLTTAAALLLGVGVLKALGIAARRFYAGLHQYRMQARYRRAVSRAYLRLPMSWHQRHPTGQLLSRANADVEAAWQPLAPLPLVVGSLCMLVVAGGAMLHTDLVLALVAFVVFPAVALVNVIFQRRLAPVATRAQALRAQVAGVAHESFDGALAVKTLGREDTETRRFATQAHRLRDAQIRLGRLRGLFDPIMEALPNLGVLAVLLVGMVRISSGAIGPGDLVQVAYLFTLLALPVRSLGFVLGDLPRSVVGWRRVRTVLDADGEMDHGSRRLEPGGGLAVGAHGLGFDYPDTERHANATTLHEVNLTVQPGRTTALVGPTGSGKTTLTLLLARLVDADSGTVTLDGIDVRDLAHGEIARTTALVPQTTFVFDGTVRHNVTLGEDHSDALVWQALRLAHADSFVAALPEGLDSHLGERGTTLSGGQRQRLALARALVRRPRLLILDDATSAVDPQVEARILAALREGMAGTQMTTVVVASRRATIELADDVAYLAGGTIEDHGTHAELLARSAGYRDLVTAYERAARRARLDGDDPRRDQEAAR